MFSVFLLDVDRDGLLDPVSGLLGAGINGMQVQRGQGDGTFSAHAMTYNAGHTHIIVDGRGAADGSPVLLTAAAEEPPNVLWSMVGCGP